MIALVSVYAGRIASETGAMTVAAILGTLRVGEANATAETLYAKQHGSGARDIAILFAITVFSTLLGMLVAFLTSGEEAPHYGYAGLIGTILGAGLCVIISRSRQQARFKQNFQDRHQTLELPLRVEVTADRLVYELGGVTQHVRWDAVDELFGSHGYWIFLAQSYAMFAPKRLFPNPEEEKRFVAQALARMTPDAQSRSADAKRFVETRA